MSGVAAAAFSAPLWGPIFGGLAAGAAGGAMGMLSGGGGGGGQQMQQGYDIVQMPQYSWTEGNRRQLADYYSGGLRNLQAGNAPQWWQNAQPQLQAGMSRQNRLTAYGQPGTRQGTIGDAMSIGAMTGLRGKRAMTPGTQAVQQYAERENAINDYLTQLGVNVMQGSEQLYTSGIQSMPGGPETQIVNKMGGVSGGNNWGGQMAQLAGTIAGNTDWASIIQGLKKQPANYNQPWYSGAPMQYSNQAWGGYQSPTTQYTSGARTPQYIDPSRYGG